MGLSIHTVRTLTHGVAVGWVAVVGAPTNTARCFGLLYACSEIWGATLRGPLSERQLEDALAAVHIVCMASGTIDDVQKFYFYAEQVSGVGALLPHSCNTHTCTHMDVSLVFPARHPHKHCTWQRSLLPRLHFACLLLSRARTLLSAPASLLCSSRHWHRWCTVKCSLSSFKQRHFVSKQSLQPVCPPRTTRP